MTAQLCCTIQHRTVLVIFPLIPQTITIAQMLSNGGEQQVLTTQPTSIEQIDYDCTNKSTESREPQWPMSFQRGTLDQTWRLGPSLRCSASSGGLSVGNSTSHKNSPAIHDVIMSSFRNNLPNGNSQGRLLHRAGSHGSAYQGCAGINANNMSQYDLLHLARLAINWTC